MKHDPGSLEQPAVIELKDFSTLSPKPERFREPLINTLDRLRAVLATRTS